jgi:hypothetical protein
MKKIMMLIAALIVGGITLAACGGGSSPRNTSHAAAAPAPSTSKVVNPSGFVGTPNKWAPVVQPYHNSYIRSSTNVVVQGEGTKGTYQLAGGTSVQMNCSYIQKNYGTRVMDVTLPSGLVAWVGSDDIANQWLSSPHCGTKNQMPTSASQVAPPSPSSSRQVLQEQGQAYGGALDLVTLPTAISVRGTAAQKQQLAVQDCTTDIDHDAVLAGAIPVNDPAFLQGCEQGFTSAING